MELNFELVEGVSILSVNGRLDSNNVNILKDEFGKHLGVEPKFIMNLQKLEFIDSTGLGGLVSCLKKCIEAGGDLKIAHLPPKPRMVFEITRAHKVFDIYDDLGTAIGSYQ